MHLRANFHEHRDLVVSLCFPIFFHPDCTVGFGVSPNHALRLVGCTTGRESHPALKILDSISGSIIAWYIIECKPFLKPGQNRDGTTFRRRTLSRGLAPSSSLSFCQSFHRVFLQAAESGVFSKVRVCEALRKRELAAWQAEQAHISSKEKQSVPDCWVSVKQFSRNDTATACQDWLRSTRLGRGSIKSHVRTVKVLGMGLFAFQERIHLWKGVTH